VEPICRLKDAMPQAYAELDRLARVLERHFRDVQDMEFTIERGKLYMLQTRRAQRSGQAAVRIACEMVDEGAISEDEAVARIPPNDLNQLLHPAIDPKAHLDLLTTGLPASPGAASGPRCSTRISRSSWAEGRVSDPGPEGDQPRRLSTAWSREGILTRGAA
jgi:pyruvate,orthophosphate dikinase